MDGYGVEKRAKSTSKALYYWIFAAYFLKFRNKDLVCRCQTLIFNLQGKLLYMYAKCLHTSSYSKYSCPIPCGLKLHHTSTYFHTCRVSILLNGLRNPAGFLACPSVPTIAIASAVPTGGPRYYSDSASFFFFFSRFYFPASGQTVVTGVVPSPPRFLPSIVIAHRVRQSHCSSIFIECC